MNAEALGHGDRKDFYLRSIGYTNDFFSAKCGEKTEELS
jgi:hypothetical protein